MLQQFSQTDKVGEIVARFPQAKDVLQRHEIDFCCGGHRPLVQASQEHQADIESVLRELNTLAKKASEEQNQETDWRSADLDRLVDHIVNTHHAYLNQVLPELSELTTTILRVHGANHSELARVHRLFHNLKMELEQHLITEETVMFPLVKEYASSHDKSALARAVKVLDQLEGEHEGAGDILKELRHITNGYELPEDGCGTYAGTYQLLQELEADLFEHIHLENNILHPRMRAELE